jgi:CDP-paratose 2-epimerase
MKILVTGSGGLIGSQTVKFYAEKGAEIIGIDNNMRQYFFGESASTKWNVEALKKNHSQYTHFNVDIRNNEEIEDIFKKQGPFDLIVHTAAQPSHDWAAKEPFTDFTINANGTLVLLENFRKHSPKGVFIFTSTNKVYGDTPNALPLVELETRYEIQEGHKFSKGIDETMSIDNSKHSLFGASKVAADVLVQEYGKYFGLSTAAFRGGCLTGPDHSGAELHGFLAYLAKCVVEGKKYMVFGYKGKQVRDNIHSWDLVNAFDHFYNNPRKGEVYNIGGARHSNISMIEAIRELEKLTGKKLDWEYVEENRSGDHIWYISDVSKFKNHYPNWEFKYDMSMILREIIEALEKRK